MKSFFIITLGATFVTALIINTPMTHAITAAKSATSSSTKSSSTSTASTSKTTATKITSSTPTATKANSSSKTAVSSASSVKATDPKTSTTVKKVESVKSTTVKSKDFSEIFSLKKNHTVQSDESDILNGGKSDGLVSESCDSSSEYYSKESLCKEHADSWVEAYTTGDGHVFFHCCSETHRDDSFTMKNSDYSAIEEEIDAFLTELEEWIEECSVDECYNKARQSADERYDYPVEDERGGQESCSYFYNTSSIHEEEIKSESAEDCCIQYGCLLKTNSEGGNDCECKAKDQEALDKKKKDIQSCASDSSSKIIDSLNECEVGYSAYFQGAMDSCMDRCKD